MLLVMPKSARTTSDVPFRQEFCNKTTHDDVNYSWSFVRLLCLDHSNDLNNNLDRRFSAGYTGKTEKPFRRYFTIVFKKVYLIFDYFWKELNNSFFFFVLLPLRT